MSRVLTDSPFRKSFQSTIRINPSASGSAAIALTVIAVPHAVFAEGTASIAITANTPAIAMLYDGSATVSFAITVEAAASMIKGVTSSDSTLTLETTAAAEKLGEEWSVVAAGNETWRRAA